MNKERVTVTIDHDISVSIKEMSEKESRSFSQMVNKILKEYVESKEGE